MIASKSFKKAETVHSSILALKPHLKPRKRAAIRLGGPMDRGDRLKMQIRFHRVKNPRWASLWLDIEGDESFTHLKTISKYKSLHLTSIVFTGMQIGASVGHFNGEIRHLVKSSRYLRELHFNAGVMLKRRFLDVKHWMLGQKNLLSLSIVPYWYTQTDEMSIDEWSLQKIEGVSDLLYKLSAQLKRLTLVGVMQNRFANEFDFSWMNKLEFFCLQAASKPNACDGEPIEFSKMDLKIIKKVLELKSLKSIVLANDYEITPKTFWISFSEMITKVTKPLEIEVEIWYRYDQPRTSQVLKDLLKTLQPNIKFSYKVLGPSYSLSLPDGIEIVGDEDSEAEDSNDDDEDDEDDENDENDGDGDDDFDQ